MLWMPEDYDFVSNAVRSKWNFRELDIVLLQPIYLWLLAVACGDDEIHSLIVSHGFVRDGTLLDRKV